MPEDCGCEVIGCKEQAAWVLIIRQDSYSADFLCDAHWQMLHLQNPRQASRYMSLAGLLAEGSAVTEIRPQGNPACVCDPTGTTWPQSAP